MTCSLFDNGRLSSALRAAALFVLVLCVAHAGGDGTCRAQDEGGGEDDRIRITSDALTTDNESGVAEFSGSVRAVQGTTVIDCDRLEVHYAEGEGGGPTAAAGSVEKIVAEGGVKIEFDDKTAVADKAEYATDTQVLVLTGENAKVTSAGESVSGARIVLHRADGRVRVESGEGRRVEAVFYDSGVLSGGE